MAEVEVQELERKEDLELLIKGDIVGVIYTTYPKETYKEYKALVSDIKRDGTQGDYWRDGSYNLKFILVTRNPQNEECIRTFYVMDYNMQLKNGKVNLHEGHCDIRDKKDPSFIDKLVEVGL